MPDDGQRHSRLSEVFARLFPARSSETAAGAAGRGSGAGAGQQNVAGSRGVGAGHRITATLHEPAAFADPTADTTLLGRITLPEPTAESMAEPTAEPTAASMADTTLLGRITLPPPTGEPIAEPFAAPIRRSSGPDSVLNADDAAPPNAADRIDIAEAYADIADIADIADLDADDAGTVTGAGAGTGGPTPPWSVRSFVDRHRRRLTILAAGIAAVGILLALPPVRTQLRNSFVKKPQPYTALYFTTPPQVDGTILTVPVGVRAVDTGTASYNVRVWTVDAQGRVDASRTADLRWDGQALSTVVSMPVNPAADYVWVSLGGSTETLHYKIAVA